MIFLRKFYLYFNTVKYLKFSQVLTRIFYIFYTPRVSKLSKNNLRKFKEQPVFIPKNKNVKDNSRIFSFIGFEADINKIGWNSSQMNTLWLYNLHYLDCLNSTDSSDNKQWERDLLKDWTISNKPFTGIGWEPYPSSLRIINIIKWYLKGNILEKDDQASLETQVRYLSKRIEYHILGNHIFANAKALIFASFLFDGEESKSWLRKGLAILNREIEEQILPDGGHFERSPMYHSIILEDLLDLISLSEIDPDFFDKDLVVKIREICSKMLNFLEDLTHPNGEISHFNDSSNNISPSFEQIKNLCKSLKLNINSKELSKNLYFKYYNDTGYVNIKSSNVNLILDCAKVGPDYIPGHAHADTLSFELSVLDKRLIVNSGTSTYVENKRRQIERSTLSHSTLEINKKNSSEIWKSFRVANRAYPFDLSYTSKPDHIVVSCSHDGYKRFKGKPVHNRTWEVSKNNIIISDKIDGNFKSAISRFILHPDIKMDQNCKDKIHLNLNNTNQVLFEVLNGECTIVSANYAEEFGKIIDTKCICVSLKNTSSKIRLSW